MTRRFLLSALATAVAGELWVPGAKLISIPKTVRRRVPFLFPPFPPWFMAEIIGQLEKNLFYTRLMVQDLPTARVGDTIRIPTLRQRQRPVHEANVIESEEH